MSKRNLLIGAVMILGIIGARAMKGCQARGADHPGSSTPSPPRSAAASTTTRMRGDVTPIPMESDPSPAGVLRLQGLVLGSDDHPAEGAVVSLGTTPPRTTRSDKGGSFAFDKLAPGPYRLEARGGSAVGGPVTVQLNERSGQVTLRLKPAAAVEATAVDARTHNVVSGAALELRGDDVLTAATGPDGKARFEGIRSGKYVVKASAPGHSPVLQSLTVADASVVERVTLELGNGAAASGEVRDAHGQPVAGIPVVAELTSTMVSLAGAREDGAITDDHGRFRFPALAAGTYRFVASDAAHPPAASSLTALDGARDHEGIVIQLEDGARISGQVVTRSNDPVPFAVVRAVVNEGALGQVLARQTQCDENGQFELGGLPRKPVDVAALHESATSDTHKLNLRDTPAVTELVLALDADGTISGSVVGANDQPVADAVVLAEPSASASRSRAEVTLRGKLSAQTDGGGKFVLRGLRSGASYLLRAAPPGASLARRTSWLRAPTKVEVNGKSIVLHVEVDGRLKGQVQREGGGVPEVFSVTIDGASSFVGGGGTGEFHVPDLPPGPHTVTVSGPSFVTKAVPAVELKPDAEVDVGVITVARGRRITGRVLREDGSPVPGATVTASKSMSGTGVVAGPAGAQMGDVRQSASGDDGTYSIGGMGITPINLGAEHQGDGKSPFTVVPAGLDDVKIDLVLKATGALRGTITQQGRAVSGAVVLASARGAPAGGTGVTTGTDGSYVFDALTPGTYIVSAILDAGGGQSVKQSSVAIKPGDPTRLDLELPLGTVTLVVHPVSQGGAPTTPIRVTLTKSETGGAQSQPAGAPPPSFQTQVVTGTDPARFSNVEPGMYRVCASLAPPAGSADTPPEGTKASCAFTAVAQGPTTQETSVAVPAR